MSITLRPYQEQAITDLREKFTSGWDAAMLNAPTGAGKTAIASAIIDKAVANGKRVFFIVDSLELVDQALDRFRHNHSCGVMQADHHLTNTGAKVQICSIQTLRNRWPKIPDSLKPDIAIIDEAHVIHKAHERIIAWCKEEGRLVVGLSATPYRKGLGTLFNGIVPTLTVSDLMKQGYLCRYEAYVRPGPSLKNVRKRAGDFAVDDLTVAYGDKAVVGDIVDHWMRLARDRRTLIFVPSRANSRALIEEFQRYGVKAAHVDGETPRLERDQIISQFRVGEIQVLSNVAVLTKGFDAPETDCLILARPTESLMMHIQQIGRGLRIAEGKRNCLILDHAGNLGRCGLPDGDLPDELDCGDFVRPTRKKGEKASIACDYCGYLSSKVICPSCGEERQPKFFGERKEKLEIIDGELVFMTPTPKPDVKGLSSKMDPDRLYREALWWALNNGYKQGWAFHFAKDICKRPPSRKETLRASPLQPGAETMRLIKYWQIKSSKEYNKRKSA